MLLIRKLAAYYYFPGEFVAFPAYEWTGSYSKHEGGPWGHLNPLGLDDDRDFEFYTPSDAACAGGSLPRLWQAYAGRRVVTPPHHMADSEHPYQWGVFDQQFEPMVELFQDQRGSAECVRGPGVTNTLRCRDNRWVVDQLLAGKRFGFIASADHQGVALAGALVRQLTRQSLYEAFMARRCFGTTGLGLRVEFTGNGEPMGATLVADTVKFRLAVTSPEPVAEVQIVRDGTTVETITTLTHEWTATRQRPGEFWYCRVVLANGEMLWTSPIWLDATS